MFSRKLCEMFKSTFFTKHLQTSASQYNEIKSFITKTTSSQISILWKVALCEMCPNT